MVQNEVFITKKNAAKCKQILRRLRWQVILRLKNVFTYLIFQNMTRGRKDIRAETESLQTSKVPPLNHSRKLQRPHIFTLSLICIVMQQASEGATGQGHFQALN